MKFNYIYQKGNIFFNTFIFLTAATSVEAWFGCPVGLLCHNHCKSIGQRGGYCNILTCICYKQTHLNSIIEILNFLCSVFQCTLKFINKCVSSSSVCVIQTINSIVTCFVTNFNPPSTPYDQMLCGFQNVEDLWLLVCLHS